MTRAEARSLLVTGSGAAFADRLVRTLGEDGWAVRTLVQADPASLPPTAWAPLEPLHEQDELLQAIEDADATILLGGVGPATAVADDARTLDAILGHARPGSTLLALTSLAVFGDAGARPPTEDDPPSPPDQLLPTLACETRVLTANDWLRGVVVRAGLVYGGATEDLVKQAVLLAQRHGVSRYFGRESDLVPVVHEDDLVALVRIALEREDASGVYHAVGGVSSVKGLAHLVAAAAGVRDVAPWDDASLLEALGERADVPRVNVSVDADRSRAVTELGWRQVGEPLHASLAGRLAGRTEA